MRFSMFIFSSSDSVFCVSFSPLVRETQLLSKNLFIFLVYLFFFFSFLYQGYVTVGVLVSCHEQWMMNGRDRFND